MGHTVHWSALNFENPKKMESPVACLAAALLRKTGASLGLLADPIPLLLPLALLLASRHASELLSVPNGGWQLLHMQLFQRRLVVKQIDV